MTFLDQIKSSDLYQHLFKIGNPVLWAPIAFLLILLILWIVRIFKKKKFPWLTIPVVALIVALGILIYPLVINEVNAGWIGAILDTILIIASTFTGNFSYEAELLDPELLTTLGISLSAYEIELELFVLLAEAATVTVLLSVLFHYFNYLRYFKNFGKKVCIFSRLNEKTIITAENLHQLYPETRIVIMDPNETEDKYLLSEAKKLNAIVFKKDIKSFRFGFRLNNTYIVLDSSDDSKNIKNFIKLVDKKKFRGLRFSVTDIYLYSSSKEYTPIIDEFIKKHEEDLEGCYVIVVDEYQNIANDLFFRKPLFDTKSDDINLVILGNSPMAETLATTAAWLGQMNSKKLNIYMGSENSDLEERYKILYPELKTVEDDSDDQKSKELNAPAFRWEYLPKISIEEIERVNPTYIILADDDENYNVQYGVSLYTYFGRIGTTFENKKPPNLLIWTHNPDLQKSLNNYYEAEKNKGIESFGSQKERLNCNNIFNPNFDKLGFAVHLSYELSFSGLNSVIREMALEYYNNSHSKNDNKKADNQQNFYRVIHNTELFQVYQDIINTYVLETMKNEVQKLREESKETLVTSTEEVSSKNNEEDEIKNYLKEHYSELYLDLNSMKTPKLSRFGRFKSYLKLLSSNTDLITQLKEEKEFSKKSTYEKGKFYFSLFTRPAQILNAYDKKNNQEQPIRFYDNDKPVYSRMKHYESEYYKIEYNRRSSLSAGLHSLYKAYESNVEDVDDQNLFRLEHKRWVYYFLTQGYGRFQLENFDNFYKDYGNKSQELKAHINLVDWSNNVGDPLEENKITYKNFISFSELPAKEIQVTTQESKVSFKEGEYDDLDLITLKIWDYHRRKDKDQNKNYGNSKQKDEAIVNILRSKQLEKLYGIEVKNKEEKSEETERKEIENNISKR